MMFKIYHRIRSREGLRLWFYRNQHEGGRLLTIKTKSLIDNNNATKMHIILHADCVLNIGDTGVSVFEKLNLNLNYHLK